MSAAAGQTWNADAYARNGRFVADLAASLVDWLAPQAGERMLDLGCGDGALTQKLVDAGAVVTGADASPELVAAARERGLDAQVVDGQALAFEDAFDAVFSNAALHWMKRDPDAVLTGVARALKDGGRFVAEMGGAGNIAAIRGAVHDVLAARGYDAASADPWFFPTVADYRRRLEAAGFTVTAIESFARPTLLPGDISGWLRTFAQAFLEIVPAAERDAVVADVQNALHARLANQAGQWTADYVRLRFIAIKTPRQ
ncbi:class I SAM-dependent methyltransferase [Solimonas marina]|uniref:Methyltransferase domain-containing protein n=1 Tax=Solimonas marina TaxID=2714601 RepID=A0A969WBU7_9GAMM|nr:class I SAM-dependent methyltransferase [Solimonas marina]NKF24302.1 methyltransferase domain-containing protein [Solimonas marina]